MSKGKYSDSWVVRYWVREYVTEIVRGTMRAEEAIADARTNTWLGGDGTKTTPAGRACAKQVEAELADRVARAMRGDKDAWSLEDAV